MGAGHMGMGRYMEMFMRHSEINRVVEDIPGGVRTTTESTSPELTAQLQAHVSSMYAHLDQGSEVMCTSQSLPTLFRHASGYRRRLTFTPAGVLAEETSEDPALTDVIRAHAREVTGFVQDGMPALMQGMMGVALPEPATVACSATTWITTAAAAGPGPRRSGLPHRHRSRSVPAAEC